MSTAIVIPAFNEEKRLQPFLASIAAYVRRHPTHIDEVIVVDDGSSDTTAGIAKAFSAQLPILRILRHEHNRGKGAAVQTGVLAAHSDQIVFMDADGATDIAELPKMITALRTADVAVGNRWMKGAHTQRHSRLRRFAGWVYRKYMALFGLGAIDTMCGFKGYRRSVARDLFSSLLDERWLFDTEIAYKAVRRGYAIKNFPIRWQSKDGSKLTVAKQIKIAFSIWPLIHTVNRQR